MNTYWLCCTTSHSFTLSVSFSLQLNSKGVREVVNEDYLIRKLRKTLGTHFEVFKGPDANEENKLLFHMRTFSSAVILIGESALFII